MRVSLFTVRHTRCSGAAVTCKANSLNSEIGTNFTTSPRGFGVLEELSTGPWMALLYSKVADFFLPGLLRRR